jgi:hypothetical protein
MSTFQIDWEKVKAVMESVREEQRQILEDMALDPDSYIIIAGDIIDTDKTSHWTIAMVNGQQIFVIDTDKN